MGYTAVARRREGVVTLEYWQVVGHKQYMMRHEVNRRRALTRTAGARLRRALPGRAARPVASVQPRPSVRLVERLAGGGEGAYLGHPIGGADDLQVQAVGTELALDPGVDPGKASLHAGVACVDHDRALVEPAFDVDAPVLARGTSELDRDVLAAGYAGGADTVTDRCGGRARQVLDGPAQLMVGIQRGGVGHARQATPLAPA